jgi:dihydrofolate synthase / folylpolyglutamate synthase
MVAEKSFIGEPGVLTDGSPPFIAEDEITAWLFSLNRQGIRPGLQRIQGVLADFGNPHHDLPTIITCGTNGKGSTTRILAQLLKDSGKKVATFTSPHLMRVYERISIDDKPVDPELFSKTITRLKPVIEKHEASWFETLTAAAILISVESDVDLLCCETGLGGRLDATNALCPRALLLTTVALDHQHILGNTIQEIAEEKLGLLKPGLPLYTAVDDELKSQVFEASIKTGSRCGFLDEVTRIENETDNSWALTTRTNRYTGLPDLGTPEMNMNASLAIMALEDLSDEMWHLPDDVAASLDSLYLPGRFQQVLSTPDWFVDTAHNPQALEVALTAFGKLAGKKTILFGGMHDKDPGSKAGELLQKSDQVVFAPINLPRSRNKEQLQELIEQWKLQNAILVDSVKEAIELIANSAQAEDKVLITGSCFIAGEALYSLGWRDLEEVRTVRSAKRQFHKE